MASKLIIDRIPPDMHVDEKGNIVWTPRLIDFNAAAYTRGHVVTADEFNTELIKQTYQGNYNTDTISVLIGLYNDLKVDVSNKANTANTNAATALSRVNIAEANSIEALGTANTALSTSEDALADVQAAVSASTEAVTIAENTINIAETAKALSEDASDKADAAVLDAEEAMRIAEGADAVAIGAEDIANEAKQIAETANNISNVANTNASNAVNTANAASQTANEAKSTASTAAYSAGNAVTTANTANTNASAALNTANTANTTSATALTKASEAITTANTAVTTANAAKEESANAISVADTASAKIEQAILDVNEAKAVAEQAAASVADKASTSYVDDKLKDYYTASAVDNLLSNLDVDLSAYYDGVKVDNLDAQTLTSAKSYTDTKIAALIDSAPETLDTFKEIADALAEDQEVLDTLNSAIGNKANKSDIPDISGKADKTELNSYVTKTALANEGFLKSVPSEYVTETELANKNYATKSEIPDASSFVTTNTEQTITKNKHFNNAAITNTSIIDISNINNTSGSILNTFVLFKDRNNQAIGGFASHTHDTKQWYGLMMYAGNGSETTGYTSRSLGIYKNTNGRIISQAPTPQGIDSNEIATTGFIEGKNYATKSDIPDTSAFVTTNTAQTITGAKAFAGQVGNMQSEAGVYLGLDANGSQPNANIAITSANTASYIDMGRPNVDYDFRIIKWNQSGNTYAQLVYGGNASGTITIPQASGTIALTSQIPSLLSAYPVGAIYLSITNTSPASFLGGTWTQLSAGYALWTATSGAGGTISAGLPNITGTIYLTRDKGVSNSGTLIDSWSENQTAGSYQPGSSGNLTNQRSGYSTFDANNVNSIYGASTTVQPPAYKVYAWRRTG